MGNFLAVRLFESELTAKAILPTLFSPRELGNDTALVVKCVEERFPRKCEQRDGKPPTPFLY